MTDVVELVGGAKDGEVLTVAPGSDGLPIEHVRVAVLPPLTALFEHAEAHPTEPLLETVVYTRTTISDETHRWRYLLT